MKGFSGTPAGVGERRDGEEPWLALCTDAVGNFIEFWGFKRNHGRVWAYLYLHGRPQSATELREALGLSKGGVSMLTRELERWRVITRVRGYDDATWRYAAETDLMAMVSHVLREREKIFISRVHADLEEAERRAEAEGVDPAVLERIGKLRRLAETANSALDAFLSTAQLDFRRTVSVLRDTGARALKRRAARKRK